ncbi:MAG: endonuclease/exonuclease/phosphatase family protein [Nannocystis sp.]|nr:endonuclease/exonuclease/phosphatase family protein [Nannocystis sp.]MBA3545685.1 endonuclease/exonuclease/phosphatase family protein [Nannocystis sp.]
MSQVFGGVSGAEMRMVLCWIGLAAAGCGGSAVVVPGDAGGSSTRGSTSNAGSDGALPGVTTSGGSVQSSGESGGASGGVDGSSGVVTSGETGGGTAVGETGGSSDTGSVGETGSSSDTGAGSSDTGDSSGGEEPVIPGPKVKIMTFNIRVGTANDGENAWDKRKDLVYQVFATTDADFVGVQEALNFQLVAIDGAVPGYDRIGVGTEDGKTKGPINAIYYRKSRFALKQSDTFWLSDTPNQPGSQTWGNKFPRAVTWGRFIEKKTDYTFYVYNTHFDHVSQNSREKSAVLLSQKIAARQASADPFAVTGDFNAGEGNLATKFLKGDAKIDGQANEVRMRDTFRVVKPDAENVGTAHGFQGGTGGNKIDYVYVPPKQKVNSAYINHFNVDGRYPSDHFPVVGVVTFAAED